jgi:type IV pilus assembly protein PilB
MNSYEIKKDKIIDLDGIKIDFEVMKLIPKEIMIKHCLIPLYIRENTLYIAINEIEDTKILKDIGFLTKKDLIIFYSQKQQIENLINHMEKIDDTNLILEKLKFQYRKFIKQEDLLNVGIGNTDASPIIKLTNIIIEQGLNFRASDIHIEPMEDIVRVRYRIDGYLLEQFTLPREICLSICSRIKLQANMDIAEKRLPQDGKIAFKYEDDLKDLRVSTLPTMYGEKIVIRILYKSKKLLNLKSLGFHDLDENLMESLLKSTHGIILVTGPTGSGKTTTLYSMLNQVNHKYSNIVTIEDPIEMSLKGINQVNVNLKSGLDFANGLRSILRQDPDIVMIGEIRDEETAEIAVRAAITGHLVISTLHTNDAASSVIRLIDMGVPSYLIADSLIACIAQRLVREICNFCKVSYEPSTEEKKNLNLRPDEAIFKGIGCVFCNYTGHKNRTVVYEIMKTNEKLRELISNCKNVDEIRNLNRKLCMRTINANCRDLVIKGLTTYEEYMKISNNNF